MQRAVTTGIDIGTHHVKVVISERQGPKDHPRILGTGFAESRGMRHGYIISPGDVTRSVAAAVAQAERAARTKVKAAYVGIGGVSLDEIFARGEAMVTRGDSEVSERDVAQAIAGSEASIAPSQILNRKIIHTIPLRFSIDGTPVLGSRPQGLKGMKVGVETLFITCLSQHFKDLVEAVEDAGIEVEDVVAAPLAASFVTITKPQKMAGCVLRAREYRRRDFFHRRL
jgi:cell division protein FtsA